MSGFELALKSTLDKIILDLAATHGYQYLDLDGAYLMSDVMESDAAALAWSLSHLIENPRAPFWHAEFEVGGKTSNDPAQYISVGIISLITSVFAVGNQIDIMDYSGPTPPTLKLGYLLVSAAGMVPAQFDRISGLRLMQIQAQVFQYE